MLTVEFKINLLAPAKGDRLVATGKVIKPGRTLTVCNLEVDVFDGSHVTPCAYGLQTLMCMACPARCSATRCPAARHSLLKSSITLSKRNRRPLASWSRATSSDQR